MSRTTASLRAINLLILVAILPGCTPAPTTSLGAPSRDEKGKPAVGTPAPTARTNSAAPASFQRTVTVQNLVADDAGVLFAVSFEGADRVVHASRRFLGNTSAEEFIRNPPRALVAQMGSWQFYVRPMLHYPASQAQADYAKKTPVPNSNGDYLMDLTMELLPDELKRELAAQLNRLIPGARARGDQFLVFPYSSVQVYVGATDESKRRLVYSNPNVADLGLAAEAVAIEAPHRFQCKVVGSDAQLKNIRDKGDLEARFTLHGLTIIQDIVSLSANRFAHARLDHCLTGAAEWIRDLESLQQAEANGSLTGIDGATRFVQRAKQWVTRSQVKELTILYSQYLGVQRLLETPERRESFGDAYVHFLIENALPKAEPFELTAAGEFVSDAKLREDLNPNRLSEIRSDVKRNLDAGREEARKEAARLKIIEGSKESQEKRSFRDSFDVAWSIRGDIVEPKSVQLYQFNSANFSRLANARFADIRADRSELKYAARGYRGPQPPRQLSRLLMHFDVSGEGHKEHYGSFNVEVAIIRDGKRQVIASKRGIGNDEEWLEGTPYRVCLEFDAVTLDDQTELEFVIEYKGQSVLWRKGGMIAVEGWTPTGMERWSDADRKNWDRMKSPTPFDTMGNGVRRFRPDLYGGAERHLPNATFSAELGSDKLGSNDVLKRKTKWR